MLDFLLSKLGLIKTPIAHPYGDAHRDTFIDAADKDETSEVEDVTWGGARVVKATVEKYDGGVSWEMSEDKSVKLKAVNLDDFDVDYLNAWNANTANTRKQMSAKTYKAIKPYALTGSYTYVEIAALLEMSESTVQRYAPRIKDAAKARRKATPLSVGAGEG